MIYHIVSRADWENAAEAEVYRGDTLETEGFIHCSTREQLLYVANFWYPGQEDLLLLRIDPDRLSAQVKYEDGGDRRLFPHVYGPIEIRAVVGVVDFSPESDGRFLWPSGF